MTVLDYVTLLFLVVVLCYSFYLIHGQVTGKFPKPRFKWSSLLFLVIAGGYLVDGVTSGFSWKIVARIILNVLFMYFISSNPRERR